jgi:hypothetical protein
MVKAIFSLPFSIFSFQCLCAPLLADDYYRIETYNLPTGVNFEASGLAVMPNGKLAVALRKGEVWVEGEKGFQLFASGLHEILGLAFHDGALYATQRAEVTKIRDTDGDGTADEYLTAAAGWGVSGAYQARADAVVRLFGKRELWCLGTTQAGHPRHPLYVAGDQKLVRFTPQVV